LDNVQAAVLDVKLHHLPEWIEHRRKMASLYREKLEGISTLRLPHFDGENNFDIYQNYVIRTLERDRLREHLRQNGVETLVHWPKPMWEHKGLGLASPHLPETKQICSEVISLPMSAELTTQQVEIVADCTRSFYASSCRETVQAAGAE
jgi:dTDP-4-amino-4,6-dideoxygalactose transaminase